MAEPRPWPAPAKLNLFLHVLGRRADGYHELQSLFQFIDLQDALHIEVEPGGEIRRLDALPGVEPGQDLCLRAARLLQAVTGTAQGAGIALEKRIPLGGGLGGGSSDAATVLVALNRLWGCGLDADALAGLGLRLGADVPVFVHGRAAWAEGVGERLTPVDPLEPWYVLVLPPVAVSTAAVFGDPELTRDTAPITISDFLSGAGRNDCEPVVRRAHGPVDAALALLSRHGAARMTGTGAAVFLACGTRAEAEAVAAEAAAGLAMRTEVVRGMNRSPLLDRLAREP